MKKLSEFEIEKVINLLDSEQTLPEYFRKKLIEQLGQLKDSILFNVKKEYELIYAGKEREVDILADTMAVPLQKVKTFQNGANGHDWKNMLVFGDNLQVLKTLLQMKQEGNLRNSDGTPGVRLIYIDPPFATKKDFTGTQDQQAYQDKLIGADFIEFLRKRIVFLRELLSTDGTIYVNTDFRKSHYIKSMLDEIFPTYDFAEIVWICGLMGSGKFFPKAHETIFCYKSKTAPFVPPPRLGYSQRITGALQKDEKGWFYTRGRESSGGKSFLKTYICGNPALSKEGAVAEANKNRPQTAWSVWIGKEELAKNFNDYPVGTYAYTAAENTGYPTQKPEALLARIIEASSAKGDIVLDAFVGSGTSCAVAEKLGRHWIGIDCGKLAIYTMQKRLLNMRRKIGNTGTQLLPNPFTVYNAGLYDYKVIKELPWKQYREFALSLFQCRDERHEISKIELDGYLGADSVLVFNYQKHKDTIMDRGFIDDLHKYLGTKIGRRFFIIAPAASVQFLEDYIERGKTRYFLLRIPYSIIDELHNRGFKKIKQPASEMDVNDTVDAVGFDFIQVPTVECQYLIDDKTGIMEPGEGTQECIIKIERFESKVISRKPLDFANLETLSMVMLDYDHNREVFDLDEVFYADGLKKNGYEVRFTQDKVKNQIMVIYIDIFGNEKREVKTLSDFSTKKGK